MGSVLTFDTSAKGKKVEANQAYYRRPAPLIGYDQGNGGSLCAFGTRAGRPL